MASDPRLRPPAPGYSLLISLNNPHAYAQPKVCNSGATRPDAVGTTAPTAGGPSALAPDPRGGF